jgi:hypothetical protein
MATMTSDARGRLSTDPFEMRRTKDGRVFIRRGGRTVTTISGAAAARLLAMVETADDEAAIQQILARATGNYRRGNERQNRA